ncbi:hypothetical protein [Falsiroseomonas sp. HW251]|uniref:hypothetical protein n=1 Tax=Falsiroseomonas sp. HW251 TaxID=3390998 RepID=UPI003D316CBA
MRAKIYPLFLLALLLPAPALADPGAPVPATPLAILGFVALVAWGIGRYAAALRADFVRLAAEASPAERLAAFRDSPAGLPEGSVRAALAVAIVLLCLPALVLSQALGLGGTGELGTILGGVIGFYFGSRGAAEPVSRRTDLPPIQPPTPVATALSAGADAARAAVPMLGEAASRAAAVLDGAAQAAPAIEAAFRHADAPSLAAALAAASQAVEDAGEEAGFPPALHQVLRTAQAATEAAAAVETAMADPKPEGLAEALSPVLRAFGAVPGLALGPAAVAGGLLLGAVQAAAVGRAHQARWMARVLDRPVPPELLPAGAWDGEAARALLSESPVMAAALADRLSPAAPEQAAAGALARLLEPDGDAWLQAEHPAIAPADAEAAVAALRRVVLDGLLDAADHRPVAVAGSLVPQPVLRAELDRLRTGGAGGAVQALGRLAATLSEDAPAKVERALAEAAR